MDVEVKSKQKAQLSNDEVKQLIKKPRRRSTSKRPPRRKNMRLVWSVVQRF